MAVADKQFPNLTVSHPGNVLHLLLEMDSLDGFVDDTMSHGQYPLARIVFKHPCQKLTSPLLERGQRLYVIRPRFSLQVRNIASGETAPVTLAQKRRCRYRHTMRGCQYLCRIHRPLQVAGYKSIYRDTCHTARKFTRLTQTFLVQCSLGLTLHDVSGIVHRLAVSYKI